MSKRKLAILVGIALGGMSGTSMASESPFSPAYEDMLYGRTATLRQYLADREAANPNPTGGPRPVFPAGSTPGARLSSITVKNYLDARAARVAAEAAADQTVQASAIANYITVPHEATVKIVNDRGQSFVWTANTLGAADLALKSIAPVEFAAGPTRVFVRHPYEHTIKD